MINHIAFCIKTFERPEACQRAICSIREYYPDANIYVADDSREPKDYGFANTIHLPYDVGLSRGRNVLVDATEEPFLLFMDDDCFFEGEQNVEGMMEILQQYPHISMVGGRREDEDVEDFCGNLRIDDKILWHEKVSRNRDLVECDAVENYLLARRDVFEDVRWREELKVSEHTDFFLQVKYLTSHSVAYHPDAAVTHDHVNTEAYDGMRMRGNLFRYRTLEIWSVHSWVRFGRLVVSINKPAYDKYFGERDNCPA